MNIVYLGGNGGATPLIEKQILYIHRMHTDMYILKVISANFT